MGKVNVSLEQIADENLRLVLKSIIETIESNVFLGFNGRHVSFDLPAGTFLLPHRLGYVPRDTFLTWKTASTGTIAVVFNYELFTKTHFSVTLTLSVPTATGSFRAFMGRMLEEGI